MADFNERVADLIKNESFVQWIVNPNEESSYYWMKWISAAPERQRDADLAKQVITSTRYQKDVKMPPEQYDKILDNLILRNKQQLSPRRGKQYYLRFAAVAAAVVATLFIVLSVAINFNIKNSHEPAVALSKTITKETLKGQKLRFQLPDGTRIALNSDSEFSYQEPFRNNRHVSLKGEAFFDVAKDSAHPFTVEAGDIRTKVVGTSFNVRSYGSEKEKAVSVVTGKVEVSDTSGNHCSLRPNLQGVFNSTSNQLLIQPFSPSKIIHWKDGVLFFEKTPMQDVFIELERWYGVEFTLDSKKILQGSYTGTYKDASLEKVMDGVSYTSGLKFKIEGKIVKVW